MFTEIGGKWTGPVTLRADTGPKPGATSKVSYELDPETFVPAPDDITAVQAGSTDITMTLRAGTTPPLMGAGVVLGESASLPGGFIGKVTAISGDSTSNGAERPWLRSMSPVPSSGPRRLMLDPTTGAISGTPTTAGTYSVTLEVTDASDPEQTAMQTYALTVAPAVTITSPTPPTGEVNVPYDLQLSAQPGTDTPTTCSWLTTGGTEPPPGLSLDPGTGEITGTPTTAGTTTFHVTASCNGSSYTGTGTAAITIMVEPRIAISTTTLGNASTNAAYSATLQANDGVPPYSWSVTSGALPYGLSLAPSTGVISGQATAPGTSMFTVTVTDSLGAQQAESYALTVTPGPTTIDGTKYLTAVACPSTSQCTAVDTSGQQVTFDPTSPGTPTPTNLGVGVDGYGLNGVACPSTNQCTAVGYEGQEVTFDPTSPGSPTPIKIDDDNYDLDKVACPSIAQCTAVDDDRQEVTFDPTSPGGAAPTLINPAPGYPAGTGFGLLGVACPSTGQCTAVDGDDAELTFDPLSPGTPSRTVIEETNGTGFTPNAVACPSTDQCTAVDEGGQQTTFNPDAAGPSPQPRSTAPTTC